MTFLGEFVHWFQMM